MFKALLGKDLLYTSWVTAIDALMLFMVAPISIIRHASYLYTNTSINHQSRPQQGFLLLTCLCLKNDTNYSACVFLSSALLWILPFSLSSLCRLHRACILISNGAKHKQTAAPACMRAHFLSICQRKQTWGRTTCWSNIAQTWMVVTGFG